MSERLLVCVGWPYANYFLHVGQAAGAYIPADIFVRYERLAGNEVVMVSGSDCHGTPITVTAEREGISPRDVVDRSHPKILETWEKLGITSWSIYTTTLTENHYATTQEIFLRLLERGYLEKRTADQLYDPEAERFLPDRYVEGTCPHCGYKEARGDQCDNCGKTLDAIELIEPRSRFTGATPVLRSSEHYFLMLTKFQDQLGEWLAKQTHWRRNVLNFSLGWITEGLQDRAITRDISWGVSVPVEGWDAKRIYVWFDAVIGYLSATREWAQNKGEPDDWKRFWLDPAAKQYYFIGKDNIPFHTIIWPAILMGYRGLNLPFDVPANQFVTFKGEKASKSEGVGDSVLSYLERYQPDAIRYCLAANLPETSDTDLTEAELVRRNNDELVATWGNLVNRVLAMTHKNFDGVVPAPGPYDARDQALLDYVAALLDAVGAQIEAVHLKAGLQAAMTLAQEANGYLSDTEPWKTAKTDKERTGTSLYVALCAINALKVALYPYLPFSSQKVHEYLGLDGAIEESGWEARLPAPGTALRQPEPLFKKIEVTEAEGEARLSA